MVGSAGTKECPTLKQQIDAGRELLGRVVRDEMVEGCTNPTCLVAPTCVYCHETRVEVVRGIWIRTWRPAGPLAAGELVLLPASAGEGWPVAHRVVGECWTTIILERLPLISLETERAATAGHRWKVGWMPVWIDQTEPESPEDEAAEDAFVFQLSGTYLGEVLRSLERDDLPKGSVAQGYDAIQWGSPAPSRQLYGQAKSVGAKIVDGMDARSLGWAIQRAKRRPK